MSANMCPSPAQVGDSTWPGICQIASDPVTCVLGDCLGTPSREGEFQVRWPRAGGFLWLFSLLTADVWGFLVILTTILLFSP